MYAPVAQWIEQLTSNQQVGRSSRSGCVYFSIKKLRFV